MLNFKFKLNLEFPILSYFIYIFSKVNNEQIKKKSRKMKEKDFSDEDIPN